MLAIDDDAAMRELIADYLGEKRPARHHGRDRGGHGEGPRRARDRRRRPRFATGRRRRNAACEKLRETSEIPIIIVSGRKDEADRVMGLELGADDYITKPFSPRELLARGARGPPPLSRPRARCCPRAMKKGARIASPDGN